MEGILMRILATTNNVVQKIIKPCKKWPKVSITIAIVGAIASIASAMADFTKVAAVFSNQPEPHVVTHEQFNTMIVPLVNHVDGLQKTVAGLQLEIRILRHQLRGDEQANDNQVPKMVNPSELESKTTNDDQKSLTETYNQVQQLQREQYKQSENR